MKLIDALTAGLVIATNQRPDSVPLDFVLVGPSGLIVTAAYWWKDPHGWDGRAVFMSGTLVELPGGWRVLRDDAVSIHFASPDQDEQLKLDDHRFVIDTEREAYLTKLGLLRTWLGSEWEAPMDEWIAVVKARPVRDAVQEYLTRSTAEREVAIVVLANQDQEPFDALVLDALGSAATAGGNDWLESLGSQWVAFTDETRPTLTDFATWVATQRPSGPYGIHRVETVRAEGTSDAIAFRSVPRTF